MLLLTLTRRALALLALAAAPVFAQAPAGADALFQDFGGQAGIAALMSDFVPRLKADPRTAHFFEKTDLPTLVRKPDGTEELAPPVMRVIGKVQHVKDIQRADFEYLKSQVSAGRTTEGRTRFSVVLPAARAG